MPRLPSSFASIRPQGPPPTIKTCVVSWRMLPLTRLRASRENLLLNFKQTNWQQSLPQSLRRHHALRPAAIWLAPAKVAATFVLRTKFWGPETGRQKSPFKRLGACRGLILDHGGLA